VFRLDVQLDWGLLVGTAMLGAKVAYGKALWRAEREAARPDVVVTPETQRFRA
jgi:hypothetical protein